MKRLLIIFFVLAFAFPAGAQERNSLAELKAALEASARSGVHAKVGGIDTNKALLTLTDAVIELNAKIERMQKDRK